MKWLDSFTFVMKSSITTLRDKIEDPERMLHQLICDMEEELVTVRESVAAAIADEIQLSRQVDKANEEVKLWLERAQAAIQRNDEAAGKDALDQKLRCEERVATLETGYEAQSAQVQKLQTAYRELEDRIQQARHKRTLLVARLARAESTDRINNAIDRAGSSSALPARRRSNSARASSTLRTPPPTVNGMKHTSAVRRTISSSVPRPSWLADMSRKHSSSAPASS